LRRLRDIYPQYAEHVAFYAIGVDPTEPLQELEDFRKTEGYPWPVASPGRNMLADLRVLVRSTKLAFDKMGIIAYRDGYGEGDVEEWKRVFEKLASQQ
jgi:hypothetical protein